ncbi:MAG TPA: MotA/TolQ/ExbB proton channel family protein [Opitutaceae bacterium]
MNAVGNLASHGGAVIYIIFLLSILLYTQCAKLMLLLYRARGMVKDDATTKLAQVALLEAKQEELVADFRNRRRLIASMVAAAPLLGLLGTVSGMARTFEGLSARAGQRSMGDLAGGISEVLVATESGLAVAIPALLVVYLAHREIDKQRLQLNRFKDLVLKGLS